MPRAFDLGLYLVTDRRLAGPQGVAEIVRLAVAGGTTIVQIRDPLATARDFVQRARTLKAILAPQGIPLIVNDRVDVAIAADADGVHVGQHDIDPRDVRHMIGPDRILGFSVGTEAEWLASVGMIDVVDYLGVGPVASTATKSDAGPAIGCDGIAAMRQRTHLPLVAIGGINAENAAGPIEAGADGIAVVSAIMSAADPQATARHLRNIVDQSRTTRPYAR